MTLYRFDQIAANTPLRVEPADTDLEHYVGLEHLDPESLKLRRWGFACRCDWTETEILER